MTLGAHTRGREDEWSYDRVKSHDFEVTHHLVGPYSIHWRTVLRAVGAYNPSRGDNTWVSPLTVSPGYRCELNADNKRICKFPA